MASFELKSNEKDRLILKSSQYLSDLYHPPASLISNQVKKQSLSASQHSPLAPSTGINLEIVSHIPQYHHHKITELPPPPFSSYSGINQLSVPSFVLPKSRPEVPIKFNTQVSELSELGDVNAFVLKKAITETIVDPHYLTATKSTFECIGAQLPDLNDQISDSYSSKIPLSANEYPHQLLQVHNQVQSTTQRSQGEYTPKMFSSGINQFSHITMSPSLAKILRKLQTSPHSVSFESHLRYIEHQVINSIHLAGVISDFHSMIQSYIPSTLSGSESTLAVVAFDLETAQAWLSVLSLVKTTFHHPFDSSNGISDHEKSTHSPDNSVDYPIFRCNGKPTIPYASTKPNHESHCLDSFRLFKSIVSAQTNGWQRYFRGSFDMNSCINPEFISDEPRPDFIFSNSNLDRSFQMETPFTALSPKSNHWIFPVNDFLHQLWDLANAIFSTKRPAKVSQKLLSSWIIGDLKSPMKLLSSDQSDQSSQSKESSERQLPPLFENQKYRGLWCQILNAYSFVSRDPQPPSTRRRIYRPSQPSMPPHIIIPLGYRCCWGTYFAQGHFPTPVEMVQEPCTTKFVLTPPGFKDFRSYLD